MKWVMEVSLLVLFVGLIVTLCVWRPTTKRQTNLWFVLAALLGVLLVGAAAFSG